jgi:sugar phosphate isomerase/epimerase
MRDRREFMKASVAAVTMPGLSFASDTAPNAPALPRRLSVLSYSFFGLLREGKIDVFGFMETCKYRYGLQAADLWNNFLSSTEESYLRKVRDALDERDLVVPNLACDQCHLWDANPDIREKNYKNALAHLNAARILGARFVRFDAGADKMFDNSARDWTPEQFDFIVKRYREYAGYARDNGFKVGAESHWGPEAWWPSMRKLCQAVDHPAFAICCHIGGWLGTQEEKDTADRECVPWVAHTHIPWEVCQGPLVEKMNNLRNGGYQGYYSVEHHTGQNEYAEVGIQLAKVRAVMEGWRVGGTGVLSPDMPRRAAPAKPKPAGGA